MKNVNLTIMGADILGNKETKAVSLSNIDKSFSVFTTNNRQRIVKTLSFAMFMQAIQSKSEEALLKINPDEKLLFSDNYAIKIRLTESKSGKAKDLDEFVICPNDTAFKECVCCDTFKYTRLCIYEDVILPNKNDNEFFVIKILIKHLTDDQQKNEDKKWTVQTVYPITFTENDGV